MPGQHLKNPSDDEGTSESMRGCFRFFQWFDEQNVDTSDYALLLPQPRPGSRASTQGITARERWSGMSALSGPKTLALSEDWSSQRPHG